MDVPAALMRFVRPSLGMRFGLFYAALLLIALANALIIADGLGKLQGAGVAVNTAGNLRWLAAAVRFGSLKAATNRDGDRRSVEADLDRFDDALSALELGRSGSGAALPAARPDVPVMVRALRVEWARLRQDAAGIFADLAAGRDVGHALERLEQDGARVAGRVEQIVAAVNARSREIEEETRSGLFLLALLDFATIVGGFLVFRFNLIAPLRRLAEASRGFAGGKSGRRASAPVQDEIGELAQAFDHMAAQIDSDVRQIRSAHQDLRKLSRAVEQSPATVIITDPHGIIEYVNPKFTEVTGYSRQEAMGRKMNLIRSGVTPPEVYRDLWETILSGNEWSGELLNRKQGGEIFWDNTRIAPLKDEEGRITHFVTVKEDVTEKKRAQEEIARLNADLERLVEERTRQLSSINRSLVAFSYSVAHDLKAPLRGIEGFADLMTTETCRNCNRPEAAEFQQRIQRASKRMGDLVDDLLRLSRVARSEVQTEITNLSEGARAIPHDLAGFDPDPGQTP